MQRYSRIPDRNDHELYCYESLESEFTAELVDPEGLLLEYPAYFVRLADM